MKLQELDSFKISDAITFHDKLNPKLWNGTKLRPEVKQQLEAIADDFLQEMGIHDLDVRDITVSGSNAAFSYTNHSDLDLHILVNISDLPHSEIYKELFHAKKTLYNDTHDITIHRVPIELYVQDASEPVVSLGEYSIKNDEWLKIPTKRRANFDQNATKAKYEKLLDIVKQAIASNNLNKIQKVLKKIKQYRQAGLDKGGEFGPENLAFKALRSQGYITKLYDLRDKLHSQHLTIENMYQPIKDDVNEAFDQPYPIKWEKGDHGDLDALAKLPDGSPLSIMFNQQQDDDGDEITQVEFYRSNSQEVTGEGDAQRIFATVLTAIQQYIKKQKPLRLTFSASKQVDPSTYYEPDEPQPNPESRAKLYDRLVQRYAKVWGYRAFRADNGDLVIYELSRIKPAVAKEDTMQYASEKTSATNPYGGLKDIQYRGSISEALEKANIEEDISRRGFLKGMGAAAVTGGANAGQFTPIEKLNNNSQTIQNTWKPRATELEVRCYKILDLFKNTIRDSNPEWANVIDNIKMKITIGDSRFQGAMADYGNRPGTHGVPKGVPYGQIILDTTVFWDAPNNILAWILGHEAGHIIQLHDASDNTSWQKKRDNEHEADIIGAALAKKIGYNKAEFYKFFFNQRIDFIKNADPTHFHPEPKERAKVLKQHDFELSKNAVDYIDSMGQQLKQGLAEASGYIPSEKEKNDPRFKTALTVDVKPDSIKKNAKAFSWLTDRAGIPPTAKANGKV